MVYWWHIFFVFKSYMLHFVLGVVISEIYILWNQKYALFSKRINYVTLAGIILLLIGVAIFLPRHVGITGVVSFLLILLCSSNALLINFLQKPLFLFFGKICFSLYLVHLPIIVSLGVFLVVLLENFSIRINIFVSGTCVVFTSIGVAYILSFVERRLIRIYKAIIV